ncbi:hypothetical protein GGR27_000952 [Lewinella antarctica]|uniref:Glycosyltransferase RgtA/B/C/D-like domain-containing protein n=1 Tax=Neolewinella antarctica TaxID=442734 RepID=A0ABX0X896_9BACT|nr:hypothetical protein [Neolewinella antarctica]
MIKLTGGSIPLLRLAAALVVALGGWGLFLATRRATLGTAAGVAAALAYCLMCSLFSYYGLSPNTEIFFNCLTIFAVALAVAPRVAGGKTDPVWHWPVAGLLLGLAMIIKPFAAAEAGAVGLFLVWFYFSLKDYGRLFGTGLLLVLGFSLPLVGVFLYYQQLGLLDTLRFYLFDVNGAYPVELAWYLRLKYMGDFALRFSPFVILGALSLVRSNHQERREGWVWTRYLLLQFVFVTIVVLITGKRFGHYQVQLFPALASLAGAYWAVSNDGTIWRRGAGIKNYVPTLLIILSVLIGVLHFVRYSGKDDQPVRVASYLRERLPPEETFFGLSGGQITYHLLERNVPTPYVHSSLLFLDQHIRAFQIDERKEAQRLLDNPNLTYLFGNATTEDRPAVVRRLLLDYFSPVDTLAGGIVIYRRD